MIKKMEGAMFKKDRQISGKGQVVANGRDPMKYGFICGTVIDSSDAFCVILLPGGSRGFVYLEEIVALEQVLKNHPDKVIAESKAWKERGIFVGGPIRSSDKDAFHVGICGGRALIPRNNAVMASELWK